MRICIVSYHFPSISNERQFHDIGELGGGHVASFLLMKEFLRKGHEVCVLTARCGAKKRIVSGKDWAVYYSLSPTTTFAFSLFSWLKNVFELRNLVKFLKPDIVHLYNITLTSRLGFAVSRLDIPIVTSVNWSGLTCSFYHLRKNGEICQSCGPLSNRIECFSQHGTGFLQTFVVSSIRRFFTRRKFRSVIVLSDYFRRLLVKNSVPTEMISVIPNFVDAEYFSSSSNNQVGKITMLKNIWGVGKKDKIVTFVGILARIKGPQFLIQAISYVILHLTSIKFVFVGRGDRGDLLRLSREIGVSDHIHFCGPLSHNTLPLIYKASDLVVVPSLCPEASSRVLLEALSSGRAVVATNCGANPEVIRHGVNGLLVEPGNVESLSNAIILLLTDNGKRRQIELEAKLTSRRFRVSEIAEKITQLYIAQIEKSRRSFG